MEPIRGTNISLALALIDIQAAENQQKASMAGTKLVLDSQRMEGQELVKMLEGLGTVVDTYV
ncbi:MAG TPA: putative motility protein [Deltaproteobacteria bacterium]|nr:putative motility protein [Deltaproteobacteria bacterium]HPR55186.1 putative motility protein [Deltaproteobacteria bacterium]